MWSQLGKVLIIIGGVLMLSGLSFLLINKFSNLDEFPGTIRIETESCRINVPVLASLVVSVVLTVILNVVIRLINR